MGKGFKSSKHVEQEENYKGQRFEIKYIKIVTSSGIMFSLCS